MFRPPTPPAPSTAGYKEPGKAHSPTNRFGGSDRIGGEEGFRHRGCGFSNAGALRVPHRTLHLELEDLDTALSSAP